MANQSPFVDELESSPHGAVRESAKTPGTARAWRVLVVEDVPSQQKLLVIVLKKAGHNVTAVASGQEAIDLVEQRPFDLVLMDIQMPGMNGLEATRAIRAREAETGAHLPIVAVTAHALNGDDERCQAAGADAYMRKPINLAEMMALLNRVMSRVLPEPTLRDSTISGDQGCVGD